MTLSKLEKSINRLKTNAEAMEKKLAETKAKLEKIGELEQSADPHDKLMYLDILRECKLLEMQLPQLRFLISEKEEELALITGTPVKYSEQPIKIPSIEPEQRSLWIKNMENMKQITKITRQLEEDKIVARKYMDKILKTAEGTQHYEAIISELAYLQQLIWFRESELAYLKGEPVQFSESILNKLNSSPQINPNLEQNQPNQ